MKRNKGIVLVSTIVVVLLGLFLGLKFINKPENKAEGNAKNMKVAGENKKKEEEKDNFLSQSLREEKGRKQKEEDEDRLKEREEDTLKEEKSLKEDKKDEEDSKTTNARGIEVYDDKYVVKKGDTLFSIAKQYFDNDNLNKAVVLIKEINNMDNMAIIKDGDKLLIPTEKNLKEEKKQNKENIKEEKDTRDTHKENKEDTEDKDKKRDSKDEKETSSKGKAYIIKKGDTLTAIANEKMDWCKSNEAIKLLIENNDLKDANDIKENQKIYIPLQK
ncbi:LysM peptidoglycan-binding domain-containing protein [Hathewaya massiliensis]|uniref:LysM peptidoglycan-binding domain-containing protein n=1 Tax=Hathewaya massiliensis TaxID=1964382 RepID=UPI0011575692|nr:LysM peptidoglycan-binding domain-containing protein [Hathewaya massiliensis]